MKKYNASLELKVAIKKLEESQAVAWPLLRKQFLATADNYRPGNVIRGTFREIFTGATLSNTIFKVSSGIINNTLLAGKITHPVSRFFANAILNAASSSVPNYSEGLKSLGKSLLSKLFNSKALEEKATINID